MAKIAVQGTEEQLQRAGVPLVGHLLWYTVPERISATRERLREQFQQAGIPDTYLPGEIRPVDAYRKATGMVSRTVNVPEREATETGVIERRYRFEEVLSSGKQVVRHLVRVDVDARQVELRMTELAALIFNRDGGGLQARYLDADPLAGELVEEAVQRYRYLRDHYDSDAIRRMLRRLVDAMDPTLFKDSGGFFFIPQKHAERLAVFKRLLEALDLQYGTMPVIDSQESRDLVRKMFEHQVKEQIGRMADLLKRPAGELQKAQVVAALAEGKEMLRQIREYQELLQQDLEHLTIEAGIVQQQMMSLLDRFAAVPASGCFA